MTLEDLQAQVQALTQQLQSQSGLVSTGRSPIIGPHTNLLHPKPSATVAKQNFFFDGMDRPSVPGVPFPTLRFRLTETGVEEKCCKNLAAVEALGPEWSPVPPSFELPSPLESVSDAMAELTEDERRLVMEEQRRHRLDAIKLKLASLSPDDLALLTGVPVKRKPGRPKKVE